MCVTGDFLTPAADAVVVFVFDSLPSPTPHVQ